MSEQPSAPPSPEYAALIDLEDAGSELLEAAAASANGRAQRVLHRHGRTTILMFALSDNAAVPAHAAAGVVSVQALRGRVLLGVGDGGFEVTPGRMVWIHPGVVHDLRAQGPSVVLVHVSLTGP